MKYVKLLCVVIMCCAIVAACAKEEKSQNWTHYVRTAGHGLSVDRVDDIIKSATETHVFGIETDNDITGRYGSFIDPTEKLEAIAAMAKKAHEVGNYAYVYIAGTECITDNADKKEHTFFKDHPDWVQRDITGRPAMFGGGSAFWISEGDEDVWISPYATEWRKIFMERVRQIAETGIDGVYVDIPYWMTHFRGWTDTWASFDDYTVAAFKEKTGIDAKTEVKIGDFNDPNFIKWVDFRITTLTEFMKEIDENVKSVNPNCMTIPEIYPGIEEAAVVVGADVYDMYPVVDVIAHEYSGGGGSAARKNPLNWFSYMTGMYTFRAFAEGKASWMLSYSWGSEKDVDPKEAMKNLFVAQLMAGTNCWDARGHVMSGSNDYPTRKEVYAWIAEHEKTFYLPRAPMRPVGIYFSQKTRNYFTDEFMDSYKGWMYLLLQSHLEFQIVTPRTLNDFTGDVLILPDVKCISDEEAAQVRKFVDSGMSLVISDETGEYDNSRQKRTLNPMWELLNIDKAAKIVVQTEKASAIFYPECPGKKYMELLSKDFNQSAQKGICKGEVFNKYRQSLVNDITLELNYRAPIAVTASPFVSTQIAEVDGKPHIFLANFKGLQGSENPIQLPEKNVKVSFICDDARDVYVLPYLGSPQKIDAKFNDGNLTFNLPDIDKGAVVWFE